MCSCITVLSETTVKAAKKDHYCGASELVRENLSYINNGDLETTFSERRAIIKARNNKWQIKQGESYYKQNNVADGRAYSWRAIPAMHEICNRLDLYSDDC